MPVLTSTKDLVGAGVFQKPNDPHLRRIDDAIRRRVGDFGHDERRNGAFPSDDPSMASVSEKSVKASPLRTRNVSSSCLVAASHYRRSQGGSSQSHRKANTKLFARTKGLLDLHGKVVCRQDHFGDAVAGNNRMRCSMTGRLRTGTIGLGRPDAEVRGGSLSPRHDHCLQVSFNSPEWKWAGRPSRRRPAVNRQASVGHGRRR